MNQSINQSIRQSINQSINQSDNQSINQSIRQSINQSNSQLLRPVAEIHLAHSFQRIVETRNASPAKKLDAEKQKLEMKWCAISRPKFDKLIDLLNWQNICKICKKDMKKLS